MSRNGSGVYTLPAGNPVVTGTTILSSWANTTMQNIADGLTQSVSADGQTPMTGALNMASNKIIALTDPTNAQDAATKYYVDAAVTGLSATYLQRANNLSDVASASTSRTNLGLGTIATQAASSVAITGGAIDGTAIGATTASTGKFTTLTATAGSIDGVTVGATTATTGKFTTLTATAGSIDGITVGATSASTGAFTNFTASGTASFTSTGAVKVPVGTTAQQPTAATGMIRYNSSNSQFEGYYSSTWGQIGGGATGGGPDQVFVLNDQTVTTNYTIPTGKNASSAGPITINTSVTVTVPDNSTWVIV
jgi:hypothetical protein